MREHSKESFELLANRLEKMSTNELVHEIMLMSECDPTVDEYFGVDDISLLANKLCKLNQNQLFDINAKVDELILLNYINSLEYEDIMKWYCLEKQGDTYIVRDNDIIAIVHEKTVKFYEIVIHPDNLLTTVQY